MRRTLPLNALRAFEAAARHMSFAAAADELCVTATAISHQIRQLEEQIGAPLFRRRPRPIMLTEAGARLLPGLSESFDAIERSLSTISKPERSSILRVTSTVAFAGGVLLPRLDDWAQENGDIELEIHGSDHPVDLRSGGADIAVRYAKRPCETLVWEPLCQDRYFPMGAPGSFGTRPRPVADILGTPLIAYRWKNPDPAEPSWEKWLEIARATAEPGYCLSVARRLRISEESNALEAALSGSGLILASHVITRTAREAGRLAILSEISLAGLPYWLVYPPSTKTDPRIARFRAWLARILTEGTLTAAA
ncbi:MAG: LysR substrate-binding domain-containing protein [Pseudomonadota bacterium]